MKSERELISEISRIGHESKCVEDAVNRAQSLLAEEIGSSTLLVDSAAQGISPWAAKSASEFLDSRKFPFRGLYTAPLGIGNQNRGNKNGGNKNAGNEQAGRLIACFGSFESPGELLERLTVHIAQQLGPLVARQRRDVRPRPEAA